MHRKTRGLCAEDRRALDLILDHGAAHRAPVTHAVAAVSQRRIAAATRLLSVLDALPSAEVPADLAARTLRRVEAAGRHLQAGAGIARTALVH
jgi:hypothetical protein